MNKKQTTIILASALLVPAAFVATIAIASGSGSVKERPEGPCDIYAANGAPCVAAHSSSRALLKSYNGPLYQVMRQSDGKTLDIGVVQPSAGDPGGYADAALQDKFCKDTYCWVTILYDQSGKENHLIQAPRGGFSGPALGGFNNVPLADWAPVTLMGHKVYGIFIAPGMGLRWNDARGTAVDDQAEGQYWVISGHHYNTGCCFDYGNGETDSRDDGDGTMETTYFGNQTSWYRGHGPGPWIMTDQENNLVGCVNEDPDDKFCETLESINWRSVTATADGAPHRWRSMGGNAQEGKLDLLYDGKRIQNERSSYDPMRKQGAVLLGNGGDNSNISDGTFYEGAMTAAGTFPSEETNQKIQENVVAAGYDVARLSVSATADINTPAGLQTFHLNSSAHTSVKFVNTTGKAIEGLKLSLDLPSGWKSTVTGSGEKLRRVGYTVEPGQTVVVDFTVRTSGKEYNGDMTAVAEWNGAEGTERWTDVQKARNVAPVRINEFQASDGNGNSTNAFIELYNSSEAKVDISGWTLTCHEIEIPYFSSIKIPSGTTIPAKGFYLMGLGNSGLAVDAAKGERTIYVRDVKGIKAGDEIRIGSGKKAETVTVKAVGTPSERSTFNGPLRPGEDPGTGLEFEEALKYDHASNMPFSVWGTGISFEPATRYDHTSNEPVLALVYALELDRPLSNSHSIDDLVFDAAVKDAGYQGEVPADLLFGGPALSTSAGNLTLRNARGLIVDAVNYGKIVDPWLGEGYQATANSDGNYAPAPTVTRPWGAYTPNFQKVPLISTGRYPDGADSDDARRDFRVQGYGTLLAPVKAGDDNVNVSDIHNFHIGQYVLLGNDAASELVQIAIVGTGGAAVITENAAPGAKKVSVQGARSFTVGQTVTIGGDEYRVEAVQGARMYWPGAGGNGKAPSDIVTLGAALKKAAKAGEYVSGTGLTLAGPARNAHERGDAVTSAASTPGRPNRY